MANHWNSKHQRAIETYVYCVTAVTSAQTRNYLFNNILYKPIQATIHKAVSNVNLSLMNDVDLKQDILIYIYTKVLPKISKTKIKATLQLIYIAARHKAITYGKSFNYKALKNSSTTDVIDSHYSIDNNIVKQIELDYIHLRVINELNQRIANQQRLKNRTNVAFLVLFKFYLLNNRFDERGFTDYAIKHLNITQSTYRSVASRCGIKSKPLNVHY
jgi:hypothetical protein